MNSRCSFTLARARALAMRCRDFRYSDLARDYARAAWDWSSSRIAPRTLAIISGEMSVRLCAVLACSAACIRTSVSVSPRPSQLQPGIRSLQQSTLVMGILLTRLREVLMLGPCIGQVNRDYRRN